jgi:phage shock protein C
MAKKLYKSRRDVKLDGVCGGVAEYLGMDSTLVRLIWVMCAIFGGTGLVLYIICAIIMPREPEYPTDDYVNLQKDNRSN